MYLFQVLVLLAFPLASLSNPLQVTLSCEGSRSDSRSGGHQAIRPAWEKENEQLIVPLTDLARKGDVDPATEEGLISILGPRFVNALYTKDVSKGVSADASLKCIVKCGGTVIKAVPCLYNAIRTKDVSAVLQCVPKSSLCDCASCLPDPIEQFVDQEICNKASVVDVIADADRFSPYVDYSALSVNSVALQAFRGDLYNYQVEQLKQLNHPGASAFGGIHTTANTCVVGSPCGNCDCCVGGCVFDTCIGVCA